MLQLIASILITLGSILSYLPQFYKIIVTESVAGISQISLVLVNIGMFCLTVNLLIFTWPSFLSRHWIATLPFFQVGCSWMMVLIYYTIFLVYKFKNRKRKRRFIYGLHYLTTYIMFVIFVVTLILAERAVKQQEEFFIVLAKALGYTSAIVNSVVYLPQIAELYKQKQVGSNSFLMYILQTPGNAIIIIFQAVIYHGHISTWITYAIVFVEQLIVLLLMIYYHYRPRKDIVINIDEWNH